MSKCEKMLSSLERVEGSNLKFLESNLHVMSGVATDEADKVPSSRTTPILANSCPDRTTPQRQPSTLTLDPNPNPDPLTLILFDQVFLTIPILGLYASVLACDMLGAEERPEEGEVSEPRGASRRRSASRRASTTRPRVPSVVHEAPPEPSLDSSVRRASSVARERKNNISSVAEQTRESRQATLRRRVEPCNHPVTTLSPPCRHHANAAGELRRQSDHTADRARRSR